MSVWIFQSPFTAGEEKHLAEHLELPLPFGDLPDLTGVDSEATMRRLLGALAPDSPPETIVRRAETTWQLYSNLAADDLIVVPLAEGKLVALAEITSRYHYHVEDGKDAHSVGIRWLETSIPRRRLSALARKLEGAVPMQLVEHADERKLVYALLKRSYNRFTKGRWVIGGLVILCEAAWLLQMLRH